MTDLESAINLLEELDPNVHSCTCSGCEEAGIKYDQLLKLLRKIHQDHEWSDR
jgi:hypothetical protein